MGTIMLIGGGVASSDETKKWVFSHMLKAAGEKNNKPKLAILSSSRKDSQTVYDHFFVEDSELGCFRTNYQALGFEPVFIPLAVDNADAVKNDQNWADVLLSCDAVYLQGGSQYNHVKALLNKDGSPSILLEVLQAILKRGGLVAGTSAGMAAMGAVAFGEGESLVALGANGMEYWRTEEIFSDGELFPFLPGNNLAVQGIGLIPLGLIVDTHFDERGRLGRLIAALRDAKCRFGIGVDEGTCMSLKDQVGSVMGDHGVFILDATQATYPEGPNFIVEHLKLHYLTDGDSFDFSTNEVHVAKGKVLVKEKNESDYIGNFFGSHYETTKCLFRFVHHKAQKITTSYNMLRSNDLSVALMKDHCTKAFISNKPYVNRSLEGFMQGTIQNIDLTIKCETHTENVL